MVYLPHWPIPSSLGNQQIDSETIFERMAPVLEKLGNPHQKLPPVIHLSGTNGKGSTAAILAKIFSCAGYKTHLYTSPHLHHCNERIMLDGEKISDSMLFTIMEEVRIASQGTKLTFMEGFTIGAFLAFSKIPADILIVETGMGGRIDATNIIEKKLATVITPISFDHVEYLGDSIERIALEKAMIIRPDTPLITASQPQKALDIIHVLASDQAIPTYYYDRDFAVMMDEDNGKFDIEFIGQKGQSYLQDLPKPALEGQHQYINCATAIATILAILEQETNQFNIEQTHIDKAISTFQWPNRLEPINGFLPKMLHHDASEIWIDGAHNEAGAFSLARWLLDKKEQDEMHKPVFIIAGFSRGKCKKEFLDKFSTIAEEIVAVRVGGEPYPEESEVIRDIAQSLKIKTHACDDVLDAVYYIANQVKDKPCRILICGSLHLARDVANMKLS